MWWTQNSFVQSMTVGQTRQQMKLDTWEWDHSCNTGNVTVDGKYLEEVDTFLILMGSKEDTLQSVLNKGDPTRECCQIVCCGEVSRDTVMVRSHGFLVSPRR